MAIFSVESTIDAPAELAFDLMADARNEPHWNSQVSASRLLSGEPIGEGSRFETINRGQTYEATITTADRPSRLVFEVTGRGFDITATFEMSSTETGTANHATFDFRPKGLLKAMFPVMKPMIRKDGPKQAERFARFVEAQAATR